MKLSEMKLEEKQIRETPGIKVSDVGFISINGFDALEPSYRCLTGENIYFSPL